MFFSSHTARPTNNKAPNSSQTKKETDHIDLPIYLIVYLMNIAYDIRSDEYGYDDGNDPDKRIDLI